MSQQPAEALALRLRQVRDRIDAACKQASREPREVRLLAVSKRQPSSAIEQAYRAGQRDFGENYVQELVAKQSELAHLEGIRWHLIGHLQRNKVRAVAPWLAALHSVDSTKLVHELGKRFASRASDPLPVFVQVNIGGEDSKTGCSPCEVGEILAAIGEYAGLRAVGLMAIPAGGGEAASAAAQFRQLQELRAQHGGPEKLPEMSLGMSRDLEVAVAHGSTWVRVGTDIFGARE